MRLRFPGLERVDPRGNPRLLAVLSERIEREGPLTFADFMDAALYHPEEGYYVRHAGVGRTGDFLTAPELHPVFGAAIGEELVELWDVLGRPTPFVVTEVGAGRLRLAEQITTWLRAQHAGCAHALRYVAQDLRRDVEVPEGVEYRAGAIQPASGTHVVLTNELLDAFGVHRLRFDGARWRELRVGWTNEELKWVEAEPSVAPPAVEAAAGQTVEVSPRVVRWLQDTAQQIESGFVLTFDYGGLAPEIFRHDRLHGTLRCFARHGVHDDPFRYVGEQDLTADVDFSALIDAGGAAGLKVAGFTTQRDFLLRWGVGDIVEALGADDFGSDVTVMNRKPLQHLLDGEGLGRVRVLLQAKGVGPAPLLGFGGEVERVRLSVDRYPALEPHNPFAPLL